MYAVGLKLWSTNTGPLADAARRLFAESVCSYVELFVVPGSMDRLPAWESLRRGCGLQFVIHNAHSAQGFNLAKAECAARNREIYDETRRYADALGAGRIIFHGGTDGEIGETVRQLKSLGERRALIENKPFVPLPNPVGAKICRGATAAELERVVGETGCGFCLDIGHAVCAANSQGLEPYAYVAELNERLRPAMFHLSDVVDMSSPYDAHPHLGTGRLDLCRLCREVFSPTAAISIETVRDSMTDLEDFRRDAAYLRAAVTKWQNL